MAKKEDESRAENESGNMGESSSTSGGEGSSPSGRKASATVEGEGLSAEDARSLRAELAKAKNTNEDLAEVWEDMQRALKSDTDPETRERAVRKILRRANFTPAEIDAYLSNDEEEGDTKGGGREEETERTSNEALKDARQARLEVLQQRLESAMERTFGNGADLPTMIAEWGEGRDKKVVAKFTEDIKREVEELATRSMHARKRKEGKFEAGWVAEEVRKAAEAIEKKYRPVIVDTNRVGRSPETDAGEMLLKSEPIKAPKYPRSGEKGEMSVGAAKSKLQEYTVDALSRLAVSTGKTRT